MKADVLVAGGDGGIVRAIRKLDDDGTMFDPATIAVFTRPVALREIDEAEWHALRRRKRRRR